MYHDVVDRGEYDSSGPSIVGANAYKLDRTDFERHLAAIRQAVSEGAVASTAGFTEWDSRVPVFLTFDDGGASAYTCIAELLERQGWRGHFFITTDWIGTPGFVTAAQIRELDSRGHVIGSHSRSHPTRMSACSPAQLAQEWTESVKVLAGILDKQVTVASVPGGYFSDAVAEAAASAGIKILFTSEPTSHGRTIGGCLVLGRNVLKQGASAETAAGFAALRFWTCARQSLEWKLKLVTKRVSAPLYLKIRATLMGNR